MIWWACAASCWVSPIEADEVSFRTDVMAVLSKAGCNAGVCHGNLNGKGGFRLSLRGDDPAFDFAALSREQLGRRINLQQPDASLMLRKPTMLQTHEGGKRFEPDSPEYRVLRDWIAAGATDDAADSPALTRLEVEPTEVILIEPRLELSLQVTAHFADGTSRDVTRWAVYEASNDRIGMTVDGRAEQLLPGESTILVRYLDHQQVVRVAVVAERPNFQSAGPAPANYIDALVFAKLRSLRMNPSGLCSDHRFLRRAYLDLLGKLPTADAARKFVADAAPDKRARLIDELLEQREFAVFWANKWCDLLRVEEKTLDRKGVANFRHWLEQSIADGKPLDAMAREIIAAQGSTYLNPPANLYRALRDPLDRGESIAQVFLGVRLQCARCHNHPFDRWKQDDYYDWAALFAPIDYKVLENNRRDQNDKHEFDGEQIVYWNGARKFKNPRTGREAQARVLNSGDAKTTATDDRLATTAAWLASADNTMFARTQANRIWAELLGRGIVDPPDDFRTNNPPSNEALLTALADDLVSRGYDLRQMIRTIMQSSTYQLSCETNETNAGDEVNYSHAHPRRLNAEQLLDSVCGALDVHVKFNGYPAGTGANEVAGVHAIRPRDKKPSQADRFLTLFGKPPRLISCDCERSTEPTLNQAFEMLSGELLFGLLATPESLPATLVERKTDELIDELYWTLLSRAPSEVEVAELAALIDSTSDRRQAIEDVTWGLLNSSEFLLRH